MKLRKYTEQQLRDAVKESISYRGALERLKVAPYGGNYDTIRKACQFFKVDISHFLGCGWNKGKRFKGKRPPIESHLDNSIPIQSNKLRIRLLSEKLFNHECENCKLLLWLGEPIPLELDHVDGNNKNNNLSNLRLLCPNCHAKTSTYRGKNIKSKLVAVAGLEPASPKAADFAK